jgi:hypothetical protein
MRTFKILQKIANSIDSKIQMTVDVTTEHDSKMLPVLDLNMWMGEDEEGRQRLNHTFYKKAVSSPFTILKRSAIGMSIKKMAHFQEALRRLRNCDKTQPWIQRAVHMSEWSNMLRVSGYKEDYRYNIMKGALERYNTMVKKEKEGEIQNLYRSRSQIVQMCKDRGGKASAATWFMKGEISSTTSTAPTPEGQLKEKIQKLLESVSKAGGGRTKVIEVGGVSIARGLRKLDPFRTEGCDFKDPLCMVDPKIACSAMSACYQVTYACGDPVTAAPGDSTAPGDRAPGSQAVSPTSLVAGRRRAARSSRRKEKKENKVENKRGNYLGITGRSLHARQTEHARAVRGGDMKNALAKHAKDAHSPENPPKFTMKLLSVHSSNLEKAVTEGIMIEKQDKLHLWNKRSEWGKTRGIVRLTAARS